MSLLFTSDCLLSQSFEVAPLSKRAAVLLEVFVINLVLLNTARAETGRWAANSAFAQINVFCQRLYTCSPAQDILYDSKKKLVVTGPKTVRGVCSAGSGPVDACNECLTNPPNEACEWHLQDK